MYNGRSGLDRRDHGIRWARLAAVLIVVVIALSGPLATSSGGQPAIRDRMVVEADEYGLWQHSKQVFVAAGNVQVTYRDTVIRADEMHYDDLTGEASFQGRVVFQQPNSEMTGSSLIFDVNTESASLQDMEGVMESREINGLVYLSGQQLDSRPGFITIQGGRMTTCGPDEHPYYVSARDVEIYPGDRMIIRGATFIEGGIPIFYWPYLTLSLREGSQFDFPRFGHRADDGWYVETTHHYSGPGDGYGAVYADYYQHRGLGGGVRHVYRDDDRGKGSVYGYTVPNHDDGLDTEFAWGQTWRPTPQLSLGSDMEYELSASPLREDERRIQGSWSLDHTGDPSATSVNLGYTRTEAASDSRELTGSAQYDRRLDNDLRLRVGGSMTQRQTDANPIERWLAYNTELRYTPGGYNVKLVAERRLHPDLLDPDKTVPWSQLSRLPELSFDTRVRPLGDTIGPFELDAAVGRWLEEPGPNQAWRGDVGLRLPNQTTRLGDRFTLTWGGSGRARAYTTDDRQLSFRSNVGTSFRPTQNLTLTSQYRYVDVWGTTPFRFDEISRSEKITGRARWQVERVTATLSTGFDLRDWLWDDVTGSLILRPHDAVRLQAHTNYDLYTQSFRRVVASVALNPSENLSIQAGGRYHVGNQQLERVDGQFGISLGGGWSAGYKAIYNNVNETFTRGEFRVARDLGCREISLSYDQVQEEYWVEYHIYAFPRSRVRVGATPEKLMFESDLLDMLGN